MTQVEGLSHLKYEIEMLDETYSKLSKAINDSVIVNALVESFCIHARLLHEFLVKKKAAGYAVDYWPSNDDTITVLIETVNEQIAHPQFDKRHVEPSKMMNGEKRLALYEFLAKEVDKLRYKLVEGLDRSELPVLQSHLYLNVSSQSPGATNALGSTTTSPHLEGDWLK